MQASSFMSESHISAPPMATLVIVTLALNVLGLSVPIAATQIFNRIMASPQSATLTILVVGVIVLAFIEALLRLGRAFMLAQVGATFSAALIQRMLHHVAVSDLNQKPLSPAASVEYLAAVHHIKEGYCGQVAVAVSELFFLPIIIWLIFWISNVSGLLIFLALLVFGAVTLRDSMSLRTMATVGSRKSEERYGFLFAMLSAMHSIKSLAIEKNILRRYERLQGNIAEHNYRSALILGRILNSAPIVAQVSAAMMLAYGAYAVSRNMMTLGEVSATVLLAGRAMAPLQRAVFIFVQLKDVEEAREKLSEIFSRSITPRPIEGLAVTNEGRTEIKDLVYRPEDMRDSHLKQVNLSIAPQEIIALSGPSEYANSALLQLIAGIRLPTSGTILLNGFPPTSYPQHRLNECVGYISSNGTMFRGTIRDNITRLGEVPIADAMSVAALLGIDSLINKLPQGLDTELLGGAAETISPGLRQQLAILRSLVTRPKLILLDNADRGLDSESYSNLHRFIGKVHGQAAMIIVSDDANLVAYADRKFVLQNGTLSLVEGSDNRQMTAYRELKL